MGRYWPGFWACWASTSSSPATMLWLSPWPPATSKAPTGARLSSWELAEPWWKLVNEDPNEEEKVQSAESTWEAVKIIILADVVMSLDNVIALVGVSGGNLLLLAAGIALTIPLVIFGSALLTSLLSRFPILVYAGAGLLVYIAVEMLFQDVFLHDYLEPLANVEWLIGLGTAAVFTAIAWLWVRRTRKAAQAEEETRG